MRQISRWAGSHVIIARLLIALIHVLLLLLVYFVGTSLSELGIYLPADVFYLIGTPLMVIAALNYARHLERYYLRKLYDFTFPFCACAILVASINNADNVFPGSPVRAAINLPALTGIESTGKGEPQKRTAQAKIKLSRGALQTNRLIHRLNKGPAKSTKTKKTLLTILAVIVMIGLLGLLATLVCIVACGSGWIGAVAVGAFGLAGIIFGFIAIVKRINNGPGKKQPKKVQ